MRSTKVKVQALFAAVLIVPILTVGGQSAMADPPTGSIIAPAVPTTVVRDCAGKAFVKPADISSIYCGDAGLTVSRISWRTWTNTSATGTGTAREKVCVPNCADGPRRVTAVDIRLISPLRISDTRNLGVSKRPYPKAFSRITLTARAAHTSRSYRLTSPQ